MGKRSPERAGSPSAETWFRGELGGIRQKVVAAREQLDAAPWETANGTIKRLVYRLVREAREEGLLPTIQSYVRLNCWVPQSPNFDVNPFHWCLVALNDGDAVDLSRPTRRRFGNELLFADRNGVPELYLIGFIYQLGSKFDIHERVESFQEARMIRTIQAGR